MQSIISIDYLQLYVDTTNLCYSSEFTAKRLDYGTKNFEILEEIYLQNGIPGSVQCLLKDLPDKFTSLLPDKNKEIISRSNSKFVRSGASCASLGAFYS